MIGQIKAATGWNRKAANLEEMRSYFINSARPIKLEVIRFAVWLRLAWG